MLQEVAAQGRTLAHTGDDLEMAQALCQGRKVGEMVSKHLDLAIRGKRTPVGHLQGHALVVVEDRNSRHRIPPWPKQRQGLRAGQTTAWICQRVPAPGDQSYGGCRRCRSR